MSLWAKSEPRGVAVISLRGQGAGMSAGGKGWRWWKEARCDAHV